ncbi:MAG TPA: transglycosylase SLT domain-containing protein [Gemmatimonadales bacterium]|jgi:soluble lytic murein transglycosylase-like protein|nr:transglycosylase SLT domain-containing protein [Gemmatimonadales bacterium]
MHIEEPDPHGRARWTRRLLARGAVLLAAALLVGALAGSSSGASAATDTAAPSLGFVADEVRALTRRLEATKGELAIARAQVDRSNAVIRYSGEYQIPADLAAAVYDIAMSEGIEPPVAFRLVQVESNFKPKALSNKDAIGYTQIQPTTARFYEPGLSVDQLYERDVNLRIGFRFLKDLMRRYDGDIELALVAYNRGPGRVEQILMQGGDPSNGYAESVLKGTRHDAASE